MTTVRNYQYAFRTFTSLSTPLFSSRFVSSLRWISPRALTPLVSRSHNSPRFIAVEARSITDIDGSNLAGLERTHKDVQIQKGNNCLEFQNLPIQLFITHGGPNSRYNVLVASGMVKEDPFQRSIVNILQDLHNRLANYDPPLITEARDDINSGSIFGKITKLFSAPLKRSHANSPRGLYLYGDVGTGKTMLMDLFYDSLPIKRKRRVHFHAFMLDVHARVHMLKQSNSETYDPIPPIATDLANDAIVLCFDEFQVTDIADAMILRRLFDELFNRGVVVVTTSNRHPDDLYKNGIQRKSFIPCIELLKERCQVQTLNSGIDYRQRSKESMGVYFTPLNEKSRTAIENAFKNLAQGGPIYEEKLNFWGRSLIVPQASSDVAKFSFKELCCQPLSAADYLELTKRYNVIILSEIPRLSLSLKNEARRFITFIDAMYDTRSTLICSAEVPPNELFFTEEDPDPTHEINHDLLDDLGLHAHDHKHIPIFTGEEEIFAFERAISRLIEMQGVEWTSKVILKLRNNSPHFPVEYMG
ncbi:10472_t:CDS:2 [Acaulospora morrowiae]|uniref:10472_t:CDS:1 n=1 Tax=Acaulospora morrowiae TaxID=94023 RepID=A0A9N9AZP9_9GLOM|nr:10472_t:CDS:2 [Acaulospora morrowiae]